MNGNSGSEFGMSTPSIPGPYHSPEQTEAFPLKRSFYHGTGAGSYKGKGFRIFTSCCNGKLSDKSGGLRIIVMCFAVLTLAVIVALAIQIYYGDYQLVPHGSVATDHHRCSTIGTDILKKGGNAVDAAIASTFCMGVVNFYITGLGSGGFMIIYSHRKRKVLDVIDFREVAPSTMNINKSSPGTLVGVPGLVRGLELAHMLYGKLPWEELVMPAAHIAKNGFMVLGSLAHVYSHLSSDSGNLFDMLHTLQPGYIHTLPNLGATLELIAEKGADVFYNGSLSKIIIDSVNNLGGNMTAQDLANYEAVRRPALQETFAGYNVIVPSLPSGGQALLHTLKLLPDLNSTMRGQDFTPHLAINLVNASEETYKPLFQGIWGDPSFEKQQPDGDDIDYSVDFTKAAGSHVSAVDLSDLYVSVVSGLNTWLGSQIFINESFILNNALINFGVGKNKPAPGKRPISYATPVIAIEKRRVCGRRLVFGSGDATLALQVLARMLVLDSDIDWSIEAPRFHLENISRTIYFEGGRKRRFDDKVEECLNVSYQIKNLSEPYQSSNIVEKFGDDLTSHSDSRGYGMASRY